MQESSMTLGMFERIWRSRAAIVYKKRRGFFKLKVFSTNFAQQSKLRSTFKTREQTF
jgi:hypothetical protein